MVSAPFSLSGLPLDSPQAICVSLIRNELQSDRLLISSNRRKPSRRGIGFDAFYAIRLFFGSPAARAASIEPELANLIKQGLLADAQVLGSILAAPVRFFERVGNGFHLRFVLQAAY